MKKVKKELVEKYEKMSFLEGIPDEDKEELSQLYENFTNFLITIGEENLVWGECHFEILFIPLTKKLYSEFKETNYVMVYEMFKEWFDKGGKLIENMRSDESYLTLFIEYYKSFKIYTDDTIKSEILKYTLYDDKNGGIAKPEYKFTVLIKTLNFENKAGDEIKLIIDEAGLLLNYENCYVAMFAIGKLNGEVFSVNETDDDFTVLDKHLSDSKTIVLYSAKIEAGKVFYRYSLIEDKPLNRIEEIKKLIQQANNVYQKHDDLRNEVLNSDFSDKFKHKFKELVDKANKSDNVLFFDKHELESLKKITKTTKISDYEVLTDDGFVDIEALHETIPYEVYHLKLEDGKELKCADNHIVFDENMNEIFVKNLSVGDNIFIGEFGVTEDGGFFHEKLESPLSKVIEVTNLGYEEVMYDLELAEGSNRRYYTNGILSHNTLLAKLLAEYVFGDSDSLIRMDMSEYMEKHSVSRMIGPPPGYVGYDQGGQLTEKVRRKPHCVILFDEIEKAHEDVFNLLLQLLEEGQLTDGLGRKVNFKNSLIIMTSNIGVKEVNSFGKSLGFETAASIVNEENKARGIIEKALKKKFRPEFLNRIDEAIIFNSLSEEDIHKIIYVELEKLEKRVVEMGYKLKVTKDAIDFLAKQGYDEAYGARPLARAIQHYIEDPVADEILNGNFNEGETINITFDKEKEDIVVKPSKSKGK